MSDVATDLTTSNGLAEHLSEVQVVDCREPYEWQAGRIEGSIHIPLNSILAGATGQLDESKTTVVVCRSGNRSELATLMLRARGFEAFNLERGLEEWEQEGRPLSTPDGQPGHVA
jgi:rhodanese-related sulfurtransferase